MSEPRYVIPALHPTRLVQLVVVVLVVAIMGALALQHSDAAGSGDVRSVAAGAVLASDRTVDAPSAASLADVSDDSWIALAISGCVALALCCVVGLALSARPATGRRDDSAGTVVRTVWAPVARWDSGSVLATRPSLDSLSISRT